VRVLVEPGVSAQETDDGGLILLSERTGKVHKCNVTASAFWQELIANEGELEPTSTAIAAWFGTDVATVRADLDTLITTLVKAGLARVEP
jgi:hypothetical protein